VFELRDELELFFEEHKKTGFCNWLNDKDWISHLAYLVDIFEQLNKLYIQMQGKCKIIKKKSLIV